MDIDIYESSPLTCSSPYQGNPPMLIVYTRHGYMFGTRSDIVLERLCGADSKAQRNQTISHNNKIILEIVAKYNQAFSTHSELAFSGRSYSCSDIEKIEILDGSSVGKDNLLATVINPNI